jgi:hypothetical protein
MEAAYEAPNVYSASGASSEFFFYQSSGASDGRLVLCSAVLWTCVCACVHKYAGLQDARRTHGSSAAPSLVPWLLGPRALKRPTLCHIHPPPPSPPGTADGQWLFLCPLNLRMLLAHCGSYPACPPTLTAKARAC